MAWGKKKAPIDPNLIPTEGTKVGNLKAESPTERYMSRFKESEPLEPPFYLTTTNPMLDCALDEKGRGIPCGSHICYFGEPGHGKSVTGLLPASTVQGLGGFVMVQDPEHRHKPSLYELLSINTDESMGQFKLHHPLSLEEAFRNIIEFGEDILSFAPSPNEPPYYFFCDGIAGLQTQRVAVKRKKKNKGNLQESQEPMGMAGLFNEFMRHEVIRKLSKRNAYFVWTNQVRDLVDFMSRKRVKHFPGGWALKHQLSAIIEVYKSTIKDDLTKAQSDQIHDDFPPGVRINYKCLKAPGPEGRRAWMPWFFNWGADMALGMWNWIYEHSDTNHMFIKHKGQGVYIMWGQEGTKEQWLEWVYASQDNMNNFTKYFKECYQYVSSYKGNKTFGVQQDEEM